MDIRRYGCWFTNSSSRWPYYGCRDRSRFGANRDLIAISRFSRRAVKPRTVGRGPSMHDFNSLRRALWNAHFRLQWRSLYLIGFRIRLGLRICLIQWNHRCQQLDVELGLSGMRYRYRRSRLSRRCGTSRDVDCRGWTMERHRRDRFPRLLECQRYRTGYRAYVKHHRVE